MQLIHFAVPLLEEANEGGDARAWSDHYEGHRRVRGRSEGAVGSQTHVDLWSEAFRRDSLLRVIYNTAEKPLSAYQSI